MRNTAIPDFFESNRHVPSRKASFGASFRAVLRSALLVLLAAGFAACGAAAQETVLWSFQQNHIDGTAPYGGLVMDSAGNLYGATSTGGPNDAGIIFELSPKSGGGWMEKILYENSGSIGSLIFDTKGNLYGAGAGSIFELSPAAGGTWTEQTIYTFSGITNPSGLNSGLIFDSAGNIYAASSAGAPMNRTGPYSSSHPRPAGAGPRALCIASTTTEWMGGIHWPVC